MAELCVRAANGYGWTVSRNPSRGASRARLREWRSRLNTEHRALWAESIELAAAHHRAGLKEHMARLRWHLNEIRAFMSALEDFHRREGPLGD